MILYFTGTGNSKYLAEILADKLNETQIDIAKLMKEGKHPSLHSDTPYIFVTPVYAWRIPRILYKWIKESTFSGNKKVYFVIDCGSEIGAASNYVKRLVRDIGLDYMGTAEVVMPENYLILFTPPPEQEDKHIIETATHITNGLSDKISKQEPFDKIKITLMGHIYSDIVNPCFYTFYIGAKKFYAADACISCGKCVDNCMLNNIELKNGKPVWGNDCTHCMACICKCPTSAIEYGKSTKGRRRYVFSYKG